MMLGIEIQFAYPFLAGIFAAVNPCGFVLLPTYLMFFLGMEGTRPGTQRAAIGRALGVAGAVSAGFMAVFIVIGVITKTLTSWIYDSASEYISLGIGVLMVVVGIATLFGKHLPFMTPKLDVGGQDTSTKSMFLYGVSYALASIGCTLPLFTSAILSRFGKEGIVTGSISVGAYGAGMALILCALTVSLALARTGVLKALRKVMTHIDLISGVVLVLAGVYLVWYGYTGVTGRRSAVTDAGLSYQSWAQNRLNDIGAGWLFVIFGGITAAAIAVVAVRRRSDTATELADDAPAPATSES
jgi:cytochrome c-type biogenesis protein